MRNAWSDTMTYLNEDYDDTVNQEREHMFMYIADNKGYVKLWSLTHFLKQKGYQPVPSYIETKGEDQFFAERKEFVNVNNYATRMRK